MNDAREYLKIPCHVEDSDYMTVQYNNNHVILEMISVYQHAEIQRDGSTKLVNEVFLDKQLATELMDYLKKAIEDMS